LEGRYLQRHGLDRSRLAVTADFTMAEERPAGVSSMRLRISVPGFIPAQRRDALLAVASHCTVPGQAGQPLPKSMLRPAKGAGEDGQSADAATGTWRRRWRYGSL
jgi:hypothetical protein